MLAWRIMEGCWLALWKALWCGAPWLRRVIRRVGWLGPVRACLTEVRSRCVSVLVPSRLTSLVYITVSADALDGGLIRGGSKPIATMGLVAWRPERGLAHVLRRGDS